MRGGMVYLRPLPVVFFRAEGPYAQSVDRAWGQMFAWLDRCGLRATTGRGYGLMRDNPRVVGAERCRYDACVELPTDLDPDLTRDVAVQKLPGGAYMRCRHVGEYEALGQSISNLRDQWVPQQGLLIDAKRPLITIYLTDPATTARDALKADVCVPVATAAESNRSVA